MKREVTVTVSRTVQIRSYEPVTVTVTERAMIVEDSERDSLYAETTKAVKRYIDNEVKKWTLEDKRKKQNEEEDE